MDFDDFDLEVQDEKDSDPEHFDSSVTTAGSPDTLTPASTKPVQLAYVKNPGKGPKQNGGNDVLLVTIDGSVKTTTIERGAAAYFPGIFTSLVIDTNNNGTNYEVILWS